MTTRKPPDCSPARRPENPGLRQTTIGLAVLLVRVATAHADQGWEGQSLHFNWENDAIRGSDRHYTQGARILYLSSDKATPDWLRKFSDHIPALGFRSDALKFGLEIGQEIYTPENLDASTPILDDQPYAGWLYATALLHGAALAWPIFR
jgi:hypothetical protein